VELHISFAQLRHDSDLQGTIPNILLKSALCCFDIGLNTLLLPPQKSSVNMANHKATKKDVRQSAKRRERNRYNGKTTRNAIRDLKALEDKAAAGEKLPQVISMIDRLAKNGIIHKNKASNLKSKLTKRIKATA
jgi:small subunit ribosomal protein S20